MGEGEEGGSRLACPVSPAQSSSTGVGRGASSAYLTEERGPRLETQAQALTKGHGAGSQVSTTSCVLSVSLSSPPLPPLCDQGLESARSPDPQRMGFLGCPRPLSFTLRLNKYHTFPLPKYGPKRQRGRATATPAPRKGGPLSDEGLLQQHENHPPASCPCARPPSCPFSLHTLPGASPLSLVG